MDFIKAFIEKNFDGAGIVAAAVILLVAIGIIVGIVAESTEHTVDVLFPDRYQKYLSAWDASEKAAHERAMERKCIIDNLGCDALMKLRAK